MHHRLQHRVHRRASAPQIGRMDRTRRARAKAGSQDRERLKHLAGTQLQNQLAIPPAVIRGACAVSASGATQTGIFNQSGEPIISVQNRCTVAAQAGCEYAVDCTSLDAGWVWITFPVTMRLRCGLGLRGTFRPTKPYPQRLFSGYIRLSQSEDVHLVPSSRDFMNHLSVWNLAGICAGISTSPTVRKIMSVKALRLRNPLARFLTILMTRLRPSEMALVRREPMKASTPA